MFGALGPCNSAKFALFHLQKGYKYCTNVLAKELTRLSEAFQRWQEDTPHSIVKRTTGCQGRRAPVRADNHQLRTSEKFPQRHLLDDFDEASVLDNNGNWVSTGTLVNLSPLSFPPSTLLTY